VAKKVAKKAASKKVAKKAAPKKVVKKAVAKKVVKKAAKPAKVAKFNPKPTIRKIRAFEGPTDYFILNKHYANKGLATNLIHAGNEPGQEFGGVSPVIDFSTTY